MKKYAAEFIGTFWLVLGGCGSAVLAAAFPNVGIGLLGEYIGRIYQQVRHRPRYLVEAILEEPVKGKARRAKPIEDAAHPSLFSDVQE